MKSKTRANDRSKPKPKPKSETPESASEPLIDIHQVVQGLNAVVMEGLKTSLKRPVKQRTPKKRPHAPRGKMERPGGKVKCGYVECKERFERLIVAGHEKRFCSNAHKCKQWDLENPRMRKGKTGE